MVCAYCGKKARGTKEHIVSSGILDLFPECYVTFDETRNIVYEADPMVKDVCANCNNDRLSYIDSYAKDFIAKYFIQTYGQNDKVEIEYDYVMIQKILLKYAYNDMRSHKENCLFFDEEIKHFLMNSSDNTPKKNVSILCGIAVNVSPIPDAMFGNLKLRWRRNPFFCSNSTIKNINYETGEIILNEDIGREMFPDLITSYVFRFNSVQFLLLCWDRKSSKIEQNRIVLEYQYPYYLMKENDALAVLPVCTDELNYHMFDYIHVRWDGLFEVGLMRKYASEGNYKYKELYEKAWKEEKKIKDKHPR